MQELFLKTITENPELVNYLLYAAGTLSSVFIANLITMLTNSRSSNPKINLLLKILNVIAMNIFKNKNADANLPKSKL